ncbi:lytic murein transglycosylase [Kineosporia mesophila]|uniref:lytic murein transglycosylase n=1 Tax=Kineosporia mesophila TaxID=566012 RepID=UPI001E3E444D|nr:lytic murein transglycosylase [Kineosporia mesophila]MCD5351405.1 lytic murein transglycosylase [Kineosporia mesophila]
MSRFPGYGISQVNGTTDRRFEQVREVVESRVRRGSELGLSLAVDIDGDRVVDLWGGHRDAASAQSSTAPGSG